MSCFTKELAWKNKKHKRTTQFKSVLQREQRQRAETSSCWWMMCVGKKNVFKSFALNVYVFEFELLCFTKHIKSQISFKNSRFQIFWRKAQVRSLEISLTLTQKQSLRASLHNFVSCFFFSVQCNSWRRLLSKGSWKQTVSISLLLHQKPFSVTFLLQKFLTQRQNMNCWAVTTEGIVNPLTSPSLSLTFILIMKDMIWAVLPALRLLAYDTWLTQNKSHTR